MDIAIVALMKYLGRVSLFVILFSCVVHFSYGQQDPVFAQYMFNNLYNNPAYSGVEGVSKMTLLHRTQWLGYSGYQGASVVAGGMPQTTLFTFSAPVLRFRSGVGFMVMDDRLGPLNNLSIQASYAYHLVIGQAKMSFGLRAGVFSQAIDFNKYRAIHPDDPLIGEGRESQMRPDVSVGVFYQAEKYFGGIAMNHITNAEINFGSDSLRNPLVNHLVATGGYHYQVNYDMVLTPSVIFATDFNSYTFEISAIATYKEKLWGGLSYRNSEAATALIGYSFLKDNALSVGYAFDYILFAQRAKQPTSHEIQLSYKLPVVTEGGKRVPRTPRFRH